MNISQVSETTNTSTTSTNKSTTASNAEIQDKTFEQELNNTAQEKASEKIASAKTEAQKTTAKKDNEQKTEVLKTMEFLSLQDNLLQKTTVKNSNEEKIYKLSFSKLKTEDIKFLQKVVENPTTAIAPLIKEFQIQDTNIDINKTEVKSYKTLDVSKTISDIVNQAYKTNKPVRIDFDKNTSVIIKIDKDGKVSAEFLPSDKAMEAALRSALPSLQQKFDDNQLPYKSLSYREHKEKNNQNNNNNGGQKDE